MASKPRARMPAEPRLTVALDQKTRKLSLSASGRRIIGRPRALRENAQSHKSARKNVPRPSQSSRSKRQRILFSSKLSLMPITGRVSTINQIATRRAFPTLSILDLLHLGFAQDAVRAENENQDQDGKSQDVFVVAGKIAGGVAFGQTENKAADHGAGN